MLTRRETLAGLLGAPVLLGQRAARKPNFIVILADDLGYGDLGCYGSPDVPTPNIDGLAKGGVRFTDGHTTAPVCSPSRAGLMTGRYQQRFGFEFNTGPAARDEKLHLGLPLDQITLPQTLKKSGYATGMVGKWHLGGNPEFHPMERGFDEYFGFLHGANQYATAQTPTMSEVKVNEAGGGFPPTRRQPIFRGRERTEENEYLTDAFGREAVAFIERQKANPFFLYVPFNAVHDPLQSTTKYLDRFASIKDERHRMLAAMTSALDDNVGRILATLKKNNLEKDTLIFFASDNGCPTYTRAGSNGPLNGSKLTLFEGGHRVPYIANWQGRIKPGQTFDGLTSTMDFWPTLVKLAGGTVPADRDGVDLMPFLTGGKKGAPHETLFWRNGPNRAARVGQWKLIDLGGGKYRMYDLASDLGEKNDLSEKQPKKLEELRTQLETWAATLMTPKWETRGPVTIPVNGESIVWTV